MNDLPSTDRGEQTVVSLPGALDQRDWTALREQMHRQFIARGRTRLVLDCEACPDLPSIAFGSFTCLARDLRRVGGSLQLVHVSEKIRQVLTRTRMDEVLPVAGTLTEVIRRQAAPE